MKIVQTNRNHVEVHGKFNLYVYYRVATLEIAPARMYSLMPAFKGIGSRGADDNFLYRGKRGFPRCPLPVRDLYGWKLSSNIAVLSPKQAGRCAAPLL